MKKSILLAFSLLFAIELSAQNKSCGTMDVYYKSIKNPAYADGFIKAEKKAEQWVKENGKSVSKNQKKQATIITIPVVVHVIYKNAAQNVPDSNIHSQIAVLNECYRKLNANFPNTRAIFDTIAADTEIEFCLASKDPLGNSTNGIIRKAAPSNAAFDPLFNFDKVKTNVGGGDTLWPPDRYLNIWTCDMSFFNITAVLGYAQFPGMNPQTDGVVIQFDYFGRNSKPKFTGTTTVHEVGHWLGMRHIWADDAPGFGQPGTCDSSDFVFDTPNCMSQSNSDCNKTINSCSVEDPYWGTINPPDMVENYMDYSKDSCMTMFTEGQKIRMYSFLNTDPNRMAIKTSTVGCATFTGIKEQILSSELNIFPNPASDRINIHLPALKSGRINIEVYNSTGVLVVKDETMHVTHELDATKWASGLYFIKVFNDGQSAVRPLVVSH